MRIDLHPGVPGGTWALLRPLTGRDELALDPTRPAAGNALLAGLLVEAPGAALGRSGFEHLTLSDRDRLLAALYRACFGEQIESMSICTACGQSFQFVFSLDALLEHQLAGETGEESGAHDRPDAEGFYRLPDGTRFRLPTVADVNAASGLEPEEGARQLLAACVIAATTDGEAQAEHAMERLAPLLDLELAADCPECGRSQPVRFSMEAFLLRALTAERRFLTREVHRLAVAYGWGLADILSLDREDRRTLVWQVEAERARGAR